VRKNKKKKGFEGSGTQPRSQVEPRGTSIGRKVGTPAKNCPTTEELPEKVVPQWLQRALEGEETGKKGLRGEKRDTCPARSGEKVKTFWEDNE